MARKTTPTFIVELPLSVARADAREMGVRLELGRQLYNACLGEGLRRLERMREQRTWAQACAMPRMKDRKPNKERAAAFAAARAAAGFTSAAISAFGTRCKNEAKWNDGRTRTDARVGAHECQLIAQQAFSALDMYAFGKRGRPRFKGKGRPLHSLQGKSADSGIYWNPNIITNKDGKAAFEFFNADTKGTYRVVIEGIDSDGNLGRQVFRYKVE